MSFDWADYLTLAQELSGDKPKVSPSREAKLRSAISRAYYAAHGTGRNHLRAVDNDKTIPSGGEVHQYVINKFIGSSDKDRVGVGSELKRLRADRNKADYEEGLALAKLEFMVRTDLLLSGLVLTALKSMPPATAPGTGGTAPTGP